MNKEIEELLSKEPIITYHTKNGVDVSAIMIMDKDLGEEESKDIKTIICGISYQDIELLRSVDKEEIEKIKKIVRIKVLKKELEQLEKEII